MIRRPHLPDVLATLLILLVVARAPASDDGSEPLYVEQDGKRIPTVIIPPRAIGARPATLQVVELAEDELATPADWQVPVDPNLERVPAVDDDVDAYYPRRHDVGYYAGYPVSVYRPEGARWWAHDPYLGPGYRRSLEDAYRAGAHVAARERGRRFNVRDMNRRRARNLNNHEKALRVGLEHLRSGNYPRAVVALTMAAELNQGDPAARIHLAQARLAQGHYEEGGKVLRRALELQPKLRFISLNLPSYYSSFEDFDEHVDQLAAWIKKHRAGGNTYFLLGYMEFQRENYPKAHAAFRVARRAWPDDTLTRSFLKLTKPSATERP